MNEKKPIGFEIYEINEDGSRSVIKYGLVIYKNNPYYPWMDDETFIATNKKHLEDFRMVHGYVTLLDLARKFGIYNLKPTAALIGWYKKSVAITVKKDRDTFVILVECESLTEEVN